MITYHICSDKSLCGVLRTKIKDLPSAWIALEELKKKWPDAMIQEVEETSMGRIYNVIEITVKKTPYVKYAEAYYKNRKQKTS